MDRNGEGLLLIILTTYLALLPQTYYNWTYREMEAFFRDFCLDQLCPSFQGLHRYAKKKLRKAELLELLRIPQERLGHFLQGEVHSSLTTLESRSAEKSRALMEAR